MYETIYFIQKNDVAYFFSHRFCILEEHQKTKKCKNKKSKELKLRACCESKISAMGVI